MHTPPSPPSPHTLITAIHPRPPGSRWPDPYERYANDLLYMQVPQPFAQPWIDYMHHRRLRQSALFDALAYHAAGLTSTRAIDYHSSRIPPFLAAPFNVQGWRGPDARTLLKALNDRGVQSHWLANIEPWLAIGASPRTTAQYIHAGVDPEGAAVFEARRAASPEAEAEVDAALELIIALTRPTAAG